MVAVFLELFVLFTEEIFNKIVMNCEVLSSVWKLRFCQPFKKPDLCALPVRCGYQPHGIVSHSNLTFLLYLNVW